MFIAYLTYKMTSYGPRKQHLRGGLLLYCNQKKNAAESHPLLANPGYKQAILGGYANNDF